MSFQEKNIAVSLGSFSLILLVYIIRLLQISQDGLLEPVSVFRLWGLIIVLSIVFTIIASILTHIISTIIQVVKTGEQEPKIEDIKDERDELIDLKGTKIAYLISSIGGFLAMLTFVIGQPPIIMFSLLILFGLMAQIIGDLSRMILYRKGI